MTRTYFIKSDNTLHLYLYKSSTATDSRLSYFKRKVLEALKASEERERREVRKSLLVMEKANYPVGTIRTWKGGKVFIKVAPGRWRPKYDAHTRGAKQSIRILQKKVAACTDAMQLMKLVEEHKQRFCDKDGNLYDWVHDLHDFAREQRYKILTAVNADVEKRHAEVKARREAEEKNARVASNIHLVSEVLNGKSAIVKHSEVGDIFVDAGETGKHGWGLKHIIEQRIAKDGKNAEQVVATLALVIDAAKDGKVVRNVKIDKDGQDIGTYTIEKNGIAVFIGKSKNGTGEQFVITGYEVFGKEKESTDAINAVIAKHGYAHDFVIVKDHVGAVMASIAQNGKKSSENAQNFADTGYIAGSQKEKVAWYFKMLRDNNQCADVNRIDWDELKKNPRLGKSLITKENVFGKPDWKALKDSGMDGNAGYLISRIYASVAKEPQAQTEESQKNYVQALGSLRERLEKCKTRKEVYHEYETIINERSGHFYTTEQQKTLETLYKIYSNAVHEQLHNQAASQAEEKRLSEKMSVAYNEYIDASDTFNSVNEKAGIGQSMQKVWNELGFNSKIDNKIYSANFGKSREMDIHDWDWCTSLQEKTPTGEKKPRKKAFELLVADNYERKGGRNIKAVSTMDLKKAFNLRDVQVGSYVQSDAASAKWHIQNIAQGLADLSDVIGIPDDKISLNGRLAIALGARGHGGALAHYEPVQRVINITKMKGGGSLAHEWFHAFDNLIASAESGNEALDGFVTEGQKIQNAKVQKAFSDVVTAMTQGNVPVKETVKYNAKDYRLALRYIRSSSAHYADANTQSTVEKIIGAKSIDEAMEYLENNPDFSNHTWHSKEQWQKMIVAHFDGNTHGGSVQAYCGKTTSQYMSDAQKIDNEGGKEYWSTIKEMGARAFAGFIEDKLVKQGCKNDYLSNHANNSGYNEYRPYPAGAERERINNAFERLFEVIKSENEIQKALYLDTFWKY